MGGKGGGEAAPLPPSVRGEAGAAVGSAAAVERIKAIKRSFAARNRDSASCNNTFADATAGVGAP